MELAKVLYVLHWGLDFFCSLGVYIWGGFNLISSCKNQVKPFRLTSMGDPPVTSTLLQVMHVLTSWKEDQS